MAFRDRKPSVRNYARLHCRWYDDAVLDACADIEPAALWIWPVLIALGKDAMHHADNPSGTIQITPKRLSQITRLEQAVATKAVDVLAEGELITVDTAKLGTLHITLHAMGRWQVPAGSAAERAQTRRDREQAFSVVTSRSVTGSSRLVTPSSRLGHKTETETETETETANIAHARARKAEAGAEAVVGILDSNDAASNAIIRLRGRFGVNAMLADEVCDKWRADHPGAEGAAAELRQVWEPLDVLRCRVDRNVLHETLTRYLRSNQPIGHLSSWITKVSAEVGKDLAASKAIADHDAIKQQATANPEREADFERFKAERDRMIADMEGGAA